MKKKFSIKILSCSVSLNNLIGTVQIGSSITCNAGKC